MNFPATRHTLIHRITVSGDEADWRQFMTDYWRPICRFAMNWGKLGIDDAEDVAATTFQVLISARLLARWLSKPTAKLRTLLCSVVRNVLSNRARINTGRARLVSEKPNEFQEIASVVLENESKVVPEQIDAFYTAWADELLQNAVEALMSECLKDGRGDDFRVLYGKICDRMTMKEIADSLEIKMNSVESSYRRTRKRFGELLEQLVRRGAERYANDGDARSEFRIEWDRLGEFLKNRGGIEDAVRKSYEQLDSAALRNREHSSVKTLLAKMDQLRSGPSMDV